MQDIACLYWTIGSVERAQELVMELIDKKLIACANILPGVSMYPWQGKVHQQQEVFVLCKTTAEKLEEALVFLEKAHDYDVPCITSWLTHASVPYAEWVASVT
jgi:periplasmic divalent cation tolerance protein